MRTTKTFVPRNVIIIEKAKYITVIFKKHIVHIVYFIP